MQTTISTILALDVGDARIGVARANTLARLASPLTTLQHTANVLQDIARLVTTERADALVVGLPRSLDGQETAQTRHVRAFGDELSTAVSVPIYWQDEALTSHNAQAELDRRGKPYNKGDIDALSATYILEDFLHNNPEGTI